MLIVDANDRGSGKTLLCDTIGAILNGQKLSRRGVPESEEEWGKVMLGIGIGAYPEGHPHIAPARLEAALDQKIAAAAAQGLDVYLTSQFSFSPERIVAWLKQLRACGIDRPVSVGMVGPTSVTALIRFAKRCGVSTSLRGLMSGAATALIGNVGPDRIIDGLDAAQGPIGDVHPHYFTFGNLVATAEYASTMARKMAVAPT